MLVIRMQRTGRKGHAMFRVVVQDSRRTPTSGKVVASLGSYDPHSKVSTLNKEKAAFYLEHGAQPSNRVVALLKTEGVKLPDWVSLADKKAGKLRNPDKLRRNQPAPEIVPEVEAAVETAEEVPTEASTEESAEEVVTAETTEEPTAVAETPETPDKPEEQAAA